MNFTWNGQWYFSWHYNFFRLYDSREKHLQTPERKKQVLKMDEWLWKDEIWNQTGQANKIKTNKLADCAACWLKVCLRAERLDIVPSLVFILPWSFASLRAINASFGGLSPVGDNQLVLALSLPPLLLHHALSHNATHLFGPQQESQHRVLKELNWQVPNPWIIARYSHNKSKLRFLFPCVHAHLPPFLLSMTPHFLSAPESQVLRPVAQRLALSPNSKKVVGLDWGCSYRLFW